MYMCAKFGACITKCTIGLLSCPTTEGFLPHAGFNFNCQKQNWFLLKNISSDSHWIITFYSEGNMKLVMLQWWKHCRVGSTQPDARAVCLHVTPIFNLADICLDLGFCDWLTLRTVYLKDFGHTERKPRLTGWWTMLGLVGSSKVTQMAQAALTSRTTAPSYGQVVWTTRCARGTCERADSFSSMTLPHR